MHIEADLLRASRPCLIAETVYVFSIIAGVKAMVTRGDSFLVDMVEIGRIDDLRKAPLWSA